MGNEQGNQDNQGEQDKPNDQGNQDNQGEQNKPDDQGNQDNQDEQNKPDDQENQDKHDKPDKIVCPAKVCEDITVTVPVEVRAHADIGNIVLKCMGTQIVKEHEKPKNINKFKIVQKMFTQMPVDFITEVEVKDERVDFDLHVCK